MQLVDQFTILCVNGDLIILGNGPKIYQILGESIKILNPYGVGYK
jgi:hypothetical protein